MTTPKTNMMRRFAKRVALIAIAVAIAQISCVSPSHTRFQAMVYPPDFSYLSEQELESSMWVLASEIGRLDDLLQAAASEPLADTQRAIQESLLRMRRAIDEIDTPGRTTQHPVLNQHLGRFRERLQRARRGADRTPPNYFHASVLSGACFMCHASNDQGMNL